MGMRQTSREGHCSVGGNPTHTGVLQCRPGGLKHKAVNTKDTTAPV